MRPSHSKLRMKEEMKFICNGDLFHVAVELRSNDEAEVRGEV